MSRKKRQKLAAGRDPVKGFVRAPKRGADADDLPTEMEERAAQAAKKVGRGVAQIFWHVCACMWRYTTIYHDC